MSVDSPTGFYYSGSCYYDPATGQSFGCKDNGSVDPGEDLCGEDEGSSRGGVFHTLLRPGGGEGRGGRYGSRVFPRVYYRGECCCPLFAQAGLRYGPSDHFARAVIDEYLDFGVTEEQVLNIAKQRASLPQYIADENKGYLGVCGEATVVYSIGDELTAYPLDIALVWNLTNDTMVTTFFEPDCPPKGWSGMA